jgi:integrase
LSSKSVSAHFALLRQLLADAVRDGILLDNPTARVRAPKKSSRERRIYSIEQINEYVRPTRLAIPVLTKALTGLPRGELLALRWKNIDFQQCIAYVHEAVMVDRHGTVSFKAPKTEKSRRPVAFPQALLPMLLDYKHEQERERALLGLDPSGDLVFSEIRIASH